MEWADCALQLLQLADGRLARLSLDLQSIRVSKPLSMDAEAPHPSELDAPTHLESRREGAHSSLELLQRRVGV
jgi:hypothetical protein